MDQDDLAKPDPRNGAAGAVCGGGVGVARHNQAAVEQARRGDHAAAVATLTRALERAAAARVTHAQLHVCYSNRAASRLALGDHAGALADADKCLSLLQQWAERAGAGSAALHPSYPKAQLRRGQVLSALGAHARAAAAFESGLAADPSDERLSAALASARRALAAAGAAPAGARRALPAPPAAPRIGYAPPGTPLALLRAPGDREGDGFDDNGESAAAGAAAAGGAQAWRQSLAARRRACVEGATLPSALLSARRAAEDATLSEVYSYVRVQADIRMPKRWSCRALPDGYRWGRWAEAVAIALAQLAQAGVAAPRVLVLGCGGGMLPLIALRAGAAHVTCAERWPHLARACGDVLAANGAHTGSYKVVSCRQYDELALGAQVEAAAHLLVADLVDDGVLTGGLLPAVTHALNHLIDPSAPGPLVIPAGLEVLAQPVSVSAARCRAAGAAAFAAAQRSCSPPTGGSGCAEAAALEELTTVEYGGAETDLAARDLDLSDLDAFRWAPSQALPVPLRPCALTPLAPPKALWAFDLLAPPEGGAVKEVDFEFDREGAVNAVAVWARVRLIGDVILTTGFDRPLALPGPSPPATLAAAADAGPPMTFRAAPPSQQPALIWLAGELPVSGGDVVPFTASHNTVRLGFDAGPSATFRRPTVAVPSFPHARLAAAADGARLEAFGRALRAAVRDARAAATERTGNPTAAAAAAAPVACVDVGCGSGALSVLAARAGADYVAGVELYEPLAACARRALAAAAAAAAASQLIEGADGRSGAARTRSGAGGGAAAPPSEGAYRHDNADATAAAAGGGGPGAPRTGILHADAALLELADFGGLLPPRGADVIVADVFDPTLVGWQGLQLLAAAGRKLLAPGGRVVPAGATVWAAGVQAVSNAYVGAAAGTGIFDGRPATRSEPAAASSGGGKGRGEAWDFSALDRYRWAPKAEAVCLGDLPHVMLTSPVKVFDFRFDEGGGRRDAAAGRSGHSGGDKGAPEGKGSSGGAAAVGPYSRRAAVALEAARPGLLNAVAFWYDLDLGDDITVTTAPPGIGAGGRPLSSPPCGQQPSDGGNAATGLCCSNSSAGRSTQGQGLQYLSAWLAVEPGCKIELAAERSPDAITFTVGDVIITLPTPAGNADATGSGAGGVGSGRETGNASSKPAAVAGRAYAGLRPGEAMHAPRAPWLAEGAGIEDPDVWAVKRCGAVLGECLARAPAMRHPPLWRDLQMLQLHCGSVGLDAAILGEVTQELAMREEAAAAAAAPAGAGGGVAVSAAACVEALGVAPPVGWH